MAVSQESSSVVRDLRLGMSTPCCSIEFFTPRGAVRALYKCNYLRREAMCRACCCAVLAVHA